MASYEQANNFNGNIRELKTGSSKKTSSFRPEAGAGN